MWTYALRRVLLAIPISLGVSIVCFGLVYLAPGDPLQLLLPADATREDEELLRQLYGFDQPVPIQYFNWLMRAMAGDLGHSIQTGRPVLEEVLRALKNTIVISSAAIVIAFMLAVFLGVVAAYRIGSPVDRAATMVSILGVSIPNYWLGIVFVIVFAVELGWLPATGMGSRGSENFNIFDPQQLRYAVLPVLTMSLVPLGIITRNTRANVADVLSQDFIEMLRAKGLPPLSVLRHAVRNALPQILAVMGLQFGYLIGGSILIETIFNWPGTGFLLGQAILARDIPILQGTILVLALAFVVTNLVVDIIQMLVDPRIKRS